MRFRTRRQRVRPPAELLGLCSLRGHTEKRRSDLVRCKDNPTEVQIQRNIPWIDCALYMGTYDPRQVVPRSGPMLYLYSTCCCIDDNCLRTHELLCACLCLLSTSFRLHSKRGREDSQITLVTQCSVSQLGDLERLCSSWTGPLSAAVINDDAAPVKTSGKSHGDGHLREGGVSRLLCTGPISLRGCTETTYARYPVPCQCPQKHSGGYG